MNAPKTPSRRKGETRLEYMSFRAIRWVGSTQSLIFHTTLFVVAFLLYFLGGDFQTIMLVVTTVVSLEAVYLSIFAQMTLNRHSKDLEEIQEDVGDIQEDVEDIQKDVDEIQEDVEDIQEEDDEQEKHPAIDPAMLERIEHSLRELGKEIAEIKRRGNGGHNRSLLGE